MLSTTSTNYCRGALEIRLALLPCHLFEIEPFRSHALALNEAIRISYLGFLRIEKTSDRCIDSGRRTASKESSR